MDEVFPVVSLEELTVKPGRWVKIKAVTDHWVFGKPQTGAIVYWEPKDLVLSGTFVTLIKGETTIDALNVGKEPVKVPAEESGVGKRHSGALSPWNTDGCLNPLPRPENGFFLTTPL